jgi:hypothetical protein
MLTVRFAAAFFAPAAFNCFAVRFSAFRAYLPPIPPPLPCIGKFGSFFGFAMTPPQT